MNCNAHLALPSLDCYIPVPSLPLAHTMAWKSLFPETILGSFRYHLPSYKQVSCNQTCNAACSTDQHHKSHH